MMKFDKNNQLKQLLLNKANNQDSSHQLPNKQNNNGKNFNKKDNNTKKMNPKTDSQYIKKVFINKNIKNNQNNDYNNNYNIINNNNPIHNLDNNINNNIFKGNFNNNTNKSNNNSNKKNDLNHNHFNKKSNFKLNNNNLHNNLDNNKDFKNDANKFLDFDNGVNKDNNIIIKNIANKDNNIDCNINIENKKHYDDVVLIHKDNISYIVSSLYCLFNNNKVKDYIIQTYNKDRFELVQNKISFLFWRVILHLIEGDVQIYQLDKFYDSIIKINPIFNNSNSIHVVDFLIFLLSQLHEEDKKLKKLKDLKLTNEIYTNSLKYENYLSETEKSFIYDNYSWINEKEMKCLICKKIIKTYSFFFTYDLNITSALNKYIINSKSENNKVIPYLTINQCIAYNTEPEILYNIYCDKCEKKTIFERKSIMYSESDSIIFLFNGIKEENVLKLIKENDVRIIIEKTLNIHNKYYEINSIIYYDDINKKYINYCQRNNKWKKYLDNEIKEEKSDSFLNYINNNRIPVIVFYSGK